METLVQGHDKPVPENKNIVTECPDGRKIDRSKSKLNESQKMQLRKLFQGFNEVFLKSNGEVGHFTLKKHKIEL